jgi:hypothetical protein
VLAQIGVHVLLRRGNASSPVAAFAKQEALLPVFVGALQWK